jgi:SAM-dependent methyltransferase
VSGFSPDWLSLRESADHRARNLELLAMLREHFKGRESISVFDLGAGTGSNLRATAPFLSRAQEWTLVDHDPRLLAAACDAIAAWADSSRATVNGIGVTKDERTILVDLKRADLAAEPAAWADGTPDLVTAAALFDLVSEEWIGRFVAAVARVKAVFYTALTHSSAAVWSPPHPSDAAMTAAFERHFGTDKGFGPSTGSKATELLALAFRRAGYRVERRDSPWRLTESDRKLIAELAQGWADAVSETKTLPSAKVAEWLAARKRDASCIVGHEDLLALPPR